MNYYQRALEIIDTRGWTRGRISTEYGEETCAGGALCEAITGDQEDLYTGPSYPVFEDLKPWFVKLLDHVDPGWRRNLINPDHQVGGMVWRWNDNHTEEEVKQALRELAEMEEARG